MRISSVYALCHLMILNTCRLKEEIHVAPKKERRDRNERRRESRGRRKERPQTIQSHSIFEQGPADSVRKTGAHPQPSSHSVGCLSPDCISSSSHSISASAYRLAWCYTPAGVYHLSCLQTAQERDKGGRGRRDTQ